MMKNLIIILFYGLFISCHLFGQEETDSLNQKRKNEFVFLPATAYTPETSFTVGAFMEYYFDVAKDQKSRMSKVQFGGIYTLRNQMYFGLSPEIYTKDEKYIFSGLIKYSKFSDRDYGMGNNANAIVHQYNLEKGTEDILNYLEFKYQSFGVEALGLRKIKPGLYAGINYFYEKLWDYSLLADSTVIVYQDPIRDEFNPERLSNTRSGFALALNYDTRKNSNSPLTGTYVQFRNWYYRPWLGSDFNYTSIIIDARKYFNFYKEQVLAVRLLNEQRYTHNNSLISKFDMSRIGGKEFARGYYEGTYLDNHMTAFEIEYRIPLWQDKESTIWQFWKRLGLVVFASGSRVYENWNGFSLKDMRYTVGFGGRLLLSAEQRVNARLDIGWGLDPQSDFDKRHMGIYIYISEAF